MILNSAWSNEPVSAVPLEFPGTQRGWVFYDGACPVCTSIVSRMGRLFERRGFLFRPLQEPWVAPALGVSSEELRREMKLRRRDGRVIGGMEAWRELGRAVWWLWPFVQMSSWPGFRGVADWGYRWIAENRYCLSGVCPLPPSNPPAPHHGSATVLELP